MNKVPRTIRQILEEVKNDKQHSKEEIILFLQEVICLYEDYDGLAECLEYIVGELKKEKKKYKEYLPIVEVFSKLCEKRDSMLLKEQDELKIMRLNFREAQQKYLESDDDEEEIEKIGEMAYYLNEPVVHVVAEMLLNQIRGCNLKENIGERVLKQQNIGFLIEVLAKKKNTFVLIKDNDNEIDYDVLSNLIARLGQKVILLYRNDVIGEENEMLCEYFAKEYDDVVIAPFSDAVLWRLLRYYCKNYSNENMVCVIGDGNIFDILSLQAERGCEVERLVAMKTPVLEDKLTYGWAGDYLSYISYVYACDAHKEIEADTNCRFSIVIPTRNSAETLRYTLQTCLSQRWGGKYEIVVSDNSSVGNTSVYDLCKEIKDKRIRYYKAPTCLPLAKNFEYAFLKCRGEFLIPIGADDGVLPWTLEVLDEVLDLYEDEVFKWDRGQYQWPDYGEGISDRLVFPCGAEKGKYEVYYIGGKSYLETVMKQPQYMYALPLLYINSGFRRSYLKTLLKKTGCLWDGPCQDIYMGIVNASINERICGIAYPLTIAGMSQNSIGLGTTKLLNSLEKIEQRRLNWSENIFCYMGGWVCSIFERLLPTPVVAIGTCYNSLMHAVTRKILPIEFVMKNLKMKEVFKNLYNYMNKAEYVFEQQLREMDFAARWNGEEFHEWFINNIYNLAMEEEEISIEIRDEGKKYENKVFSDGQVVVDASKYGVKNIYHAAILAERISEY